jgi:uncharacterized protein (DUF2236 family)
MPVTSLEALREGFGRFSAPPSDDGRVGPGSVLWEMSCRWWPNALGGWQAITTLLQYPPMAETIASAMRRQHTFNEFRQLIWGAAIATFGDTEQVERMRRRAAETHRRLRGVLPEEVDRERFPERTYRADDPTHMEIVYVLLVHPLLQAQEACHRPLTRAERDVYCAEAARCIGHTFDIEALAPTTFDALDERHREIVATRLQVTPQARETRRQMLQLELNGVPMSALDAVGSWLLAPRAAEAFGITRGDAPPRVASRPATEHDLLPMAHQAIEAAATRRRAQPAFSVA